MKDEFKEILVLQTEGYLRPKKQLIFLFFLPVTCFGALHNCNLLYKGEMNCYNFFSAKGLSFSVKI